MAPVEVTRCPRGRWGSTGGHRAYDAPIVEARAGAVVAEYEESPPEDESDLMMEHFAGAGAAGQSQEDAWADWNYSRGNGR